MKPRAALLLTAALFFSALPASVRAQYQGIDDLKIAKPEDKQDYQTTPPPEGAKVLFDGKSLDQWSKTDGKPAQWELKDGVGQVKGGDVMTKEKFAGPFYLHVEFRVPYVPQQTGQGRGNSGVYVHGRYEVQVLDSYGLQSKDNDCGAIYTVAAPLVNACKAPTIWQAYDIVFTPPKFEGGKKTELARMTVFQNGIKIQNDQKINKDNTTSGLGGDPSTPGPIMLQDHGHPVQYRNVWIVPVKEGEEPKSVAAIEKK